MQQLESRLSAFQLLLHENGPVPPALSGRELYRNYTIASRRILTAGCTIFPHNNSFIKALDEDGNQPVKWLAFEPSGKHPYHIGDKPISYYFVIRDFPEEQRFATFLAIGLMPEVYDSLRTGVNSGNPEAKIVLENLDQLLRHGNHDWLHACMLNIRQNYGNKKCFSYPSLLRDHYQAATTSSWRDLPEFLPSQNDFTNAGINLAPVDAFSYKLAHEIWAKRFAEQPESKERMLDQINSCFSSGTKLFKDKEQVIYFLSLTAAFAGQILNLESPEMQKIMWNRQHVSADDLLTAAYKFIPSTKWLQTDAYAQAHRNAGLPYDKAATAAAHFYAEINRSGIFIQEPFLREFQKYPLETTQTAAIHPLLRVIAVGFYRPINPITK